MSTEAKPDMLRVSVGDGKYTLVMDHTGKQFALRHGEPWRDLVGDKFTLALGQAVEDARAALKHAVEELESYHIDWAKLSRESPDYDPAYKPEFPASVRFHRERLEAMK